MHRREYRVMAGIIAVIFGVLASIAHPPGVFVIFLPSVALAMALSGDARDFSVGLAAIICLLELAAIVVAIRGVWAWLRRRARRLSP
jgi:hypothetical protein